MDLIAVEGVVRGRVQGVGFRYFVLRSATRLGLRGWVANESDGTVRFLAEGSQEQVGELLRLVRMGPTGARVETVQTIDRPAAGRHDRFSVRASGHRGD